ncbi:hypothetical protein K0T92_21600 [Paenibacillus oenotherae]|uniref:Uncharacterized protein n=1 Tax=Paenibacillus oenotherae TaxID=1435645 RepID=A0ABS7DBK4_9BACL|nr:hypothetical protein [Paenibacillus oenotherae]MBW7477318.1 hypothetical protein [Paenibacillus oenotherae]
MLAGANIWTDPACAEQGEVANPQLTRQITQTIPYGDGKGGGKPAEEQVFPLKSGIWRKSL